MPIKPTTGEQKTWKEFFVEWKEGMQKVTPLQQAQSAQWGYIITLIGIFWGIIFALRLSMLWLVVVLIGSIIVTGTATLGNWQKIQIFEQVKKIMDENLKGGQNNGI